MAIYRRLRRHFGPLHWWPARSPFEVCVGAILTQNTAWTHVEKAIANLRGARVLSPRRIQALPLPDLASLIRPAGYYNVKARRLRAFVDHLHERHGGRLDRLFDQEVPALRDELLSVHGIGRETADSMILYAAGLPTFVVDAYTCRVFHRHGYVPPDADYEEVKDFFETHLPRDPDLWNDFHAQIVRVGKDHCRTRPRCEGCPLESLPHVT